MQNGLVLGKFMPLHTGHVALIRFAASHCAHLIVLVCASPTEPIPGAIRLQWLRETFPDCRSVEIRLIEYDETRLPNTSVSSMEVSRLWADFLRPLLPAVDAVFSSEPYGDYLAGFLGAQHLPFDIPRRQQPVSGTLIRHQPDRYRAFLPPAVRAYYVKKICLYGTESTGKSTLTEMLAEHFETCFVPEMARQVLQHTAECRPEHLEQIAALQATTIVQTLPRANRLLFVDTDLNITRSYSWFLFGRELVVPDWIANANQFDLYLFSDRDAPFVQDGTRLPLEDRERLHLSHREELQRRGIPYVMIQGTWEQRFQQAVAAVEALLNT